MMMMMVGSFPVMKLHQSSGRQGWLICSDIQGRKWETLLYTPYLTPGCSTRVKMDKLAVLICLPIIPRCDYRMSQQSDDSVTTSENDGLWTKVISELEWTSLYLRCCPHFCPQLTTPTTAQTTPS